MNPQDWKRNVQKTLDIFVIVLFLAVCALGIAFCVWVMERIPMDKF